MRLILIQNFNYMLRLIHGLPILGTVLVDMQSPGRLNIARSAWEFYTSDRNRTQFFLTGKFWASGFHFRFWNRIFLASGFVRFSFPRFQNRKFSGIRFCKPDENRNVFAVRLCPFLKTGKFSPSGFENRNFAFRFLNFTIINPKFQTTHLSLSIPNNT